MENRKKMLAVMFVTAMCIASVSAVCLTDTQTETSAAAGTKGFYTYKIALNATTGAVTVTNESGPDAVTPASVGSSGAGTSAWQTSGGENMGAWKFDSKTGIGPFNSFYAAFDTTNGNKLLGKLDPNDLTKYLAGGDVEADANIMWILPTVYWKTDAEGSLILTNDPAAGGTAYAHTVNGVTYQYLAIGVYEASGDTTSGMYSKTGSTPVSKEITTYKWMMNEQTVATDDGKNSNGRAMLWNFYQYSLYKYCVTTVIGGFGFGNVGFGPTGGIQQTGATASLGPYGNIGSENGEGVYASSGFKIFLENVWGGGNDAIADIYVDGGGGS